MHGTHELCMRCLFIAICGGAPGHCSSSSLPHRSRRPHALACLPGDSVASAVDITAAVARLPVRRCSLRKARCVDFSHWFLFIIIIDVRGIFIAVSDTRHSQRRPRTAAGGRVACARARFAWQRQRRVQSYGLAHRRVAWYNGAPLACARLFSCRHLRHLKHSRPEECHGSCRKKSLTVLHIRAVHADYGYARGGRVHGFPAEGVGGEAFSAPHPSNYFVLQ